MYNWGTTRAIAEALGIRNDKIPANFSMEPTTITTSQGDITVACYPSESKGNRRPHRLFIICRKCQREIPMGRMGQHTRRRDHNPFLTTKQG